MPDQKEIEQLLKTIGFDNLVLSDKDHALIKKQADLHIDLASIAKGYGVDEIVEVIRQNGYRDCLVEIGGEVYASGTAGNGKSWRVGINTPRKDASLTDVYQVVHLKDQALATSGDYRNFFESGGKRYSHIINPKTGYPVKNGVVSVSVQADSCTMADGLATAIMVMGHSRGLKRVNQLENVECFIIVADEDKHISNYPSENFKLTE
jgi:thiamine biosynthesis lipoprotein